MTDASIPEIREIVTRAEALASGAKRFFLCVPCKHGHLVERFTSNQRCVACSYKACAEWHAAHPEFGREKARRQFLHDPDTIRWRQKQWRALNAHKIAEAGRAWREANPGRNALRAKRWEANNLEKRRINSIASKGKRRSRIADGPMHSVSASDIAAILTRQKYRCAWCNKSIKKRWHMDHVMPLARGGAHSATNLVGACPTCNIRKHAKDPIDWARSLGRLL